MHFVLLLTFHCHPLREDVSWNSPSVGFTKTPSRHPLREDVSWNIVTSAEWRGDKVILFVRMWVEICMKGCNYDGQGSSSSWGCELKYQCGAVKRKGNIILFVRMWVEMYYRNANDGRCVVILFVRMWVEILSPTIWLFHERSSSSWGCELKYYRNEDIKKAAFVTLFVRMWVEMSLWSGLLPCLHCHPLREDVSWNKFYIHRI